MRSVRSPLGAVSLFILCTSSCSSKRDFSRDSEYGGDAGSAGVAGGGHGGKSSVNSASLGGQANGGGGRNGGGKRETGGLDSNGGDNSGEEHSGAGGVGAAEPGQSETGHSGASGAASSGAAGRGGAAEGSVGASGAGGASTEPKNAGGAAPGGATGGGVATGGAAGQSAGGGAATGGAATGGHSAGGSTGAGGRASGGSATGGSVGDTTAPSVTNVSPSNGATGVVSTSTIVITFSEAMDQSSVQSALSISGLLSGDFGLAWNGASTVLTITPRNGLSYNTGSDTSTAARTYTLTISTGAKDSSGNALSNAYTSKFSTLRKLTQSFSPTVGAAYYDYGVAMDGTVPACGGTSDSFELGHTVSLAAAGDNFGLVGYANPLPANVAGIESVKLQARQGTPEGDFYSTGLVVLKELAYQTIDKTVSGAPAVHNFGTFCSSYSTNPSMDITSQFASEIGSGQRNFLYEFSGSGGAANTYAVFYCGTTLNVTYLTP